MTDSEALQASADLWWLAIFLWFGLALAYRRYRGNPVFATPDPGAVFLERWASGRFGSGMMARLNTARNCLQVQVSGGVLRIHPHFPFTLGFVPELYSMDQVVPLHRVRSAVILGGRRAQFVEVKALSDNGEEQTLLLLLRHGEKFIAAVCSPAPVAESAA